MSESFNPTVVLVHGAFTDGSSWNKVIARLQAAGVRVKAVANPLRGLMSDGAYVASAASQIDGPVILVGHSYGGAVITYAGSKAENVKGLVYVAAYAPDEGESIRDSVAGYPAEGDSAADRKRYPVGDGSTGVEITLQEGRYRTVFAGDTVPGYPAEGDPAAARKQYALSDSGTGVETTLQEDRYRSVFAVDLTDEEIAVGAVNQRPLAAAAVAEKLAVQPAWKRLPSWWAIGSADNAINPEAQRVRAKLVGATTLEIQGGSHSIAVSHPDDIAGLILDSIRAVSTT